VSHFESRVREVAGIVAELPQHYALWWELGHPEIRSKWKSQFEDHSDFFDSSARAHFQSVLVMTYQLLDRRSDVISSRTLLDEIRISHAKLCAQCDAIMAPHQEIYDRMNGLRSKVLAHRDAACGPDTLFALAALSPEAIGSAVDTLCRVMNDLYFALVPNAEEFEFYEETTHRADCARDDVRRIVAAL
jgi:hypothetical protein